MSTIHRLTEALSLKRVLPALVPGMGYGMMEVGDGRTASTELWGRCSKRRWIRRNAA